MSSAALERGAVRVLRIRPDLVAVDLATPAFALVAVPFDMLLEPLEVAVDPALEEAQGVARGLDRTLGLGVETEGDLRLLRAGGLEQDGTGVLGTSVLLPGDPDVGCLVGDLGRPGLLASGDGRGPARVLSSSCSTRSTPSMNVGNSSNWVQWS